MERVLLRVGEVAELLGVGRSKAYEMVASGLLPSVRVGERSVRVPLTALQQWVEEHIEGGDDGRRN